MTNKQDNRKHILSGLEAFLKNKGFKKKAFTFRRETEKGLFQIIELRLGPAWSYTDGQINLEFGIFSDEWHKYLNRWKTPSPIRTADCEIRDCYCIIGEKGNNHNWFRLTENLDDLILDMINVLDNSILPYLDKHKTRDEIIKSYRLNGEKMGLPPRHKLSIAVLTLGNGDMDKGISLVHDEYIANQKNPFYVGVYETIRDEFKRNDRITAVCLNGGLMILSTFGLG